MDLQQFFSCLAENNINVAWKLIWSHIYHWENVPIQSLADTDENVSLLMKTVGEEMNSILSSDSLEKPQVLLSIHQRLVSCETISKLTASDTSTPQAAFLHSYYTWVENLLQFISASRTANWPLHLASLDQIAKYFLPMIYVSIGYPLFFLLFNRYACNERWGSCLLGSFAEWCHLCLQNWHSIFWPWSWSCTRARNQMAEKVWWNYRPDSEWKCIITFPIGFSWNTANCGSLKRRTQQQSQPIINWNHTTRDRYFRMCKSSVVGYLPILISHFLRLMKDFRIFYLTRWFPVAQWCYCTHAASSHPCCTINVHSVDTDVYGLLVFINKGQSAWNY